MASIASMEKAFFKGCIKENLTITYVIKTANNNAKNILKIFILIGKTKLTIIAAKAPISDEKIKTSTISFHKIFLTCFLVKPNNLNRAMFFLCL